MLIVKLATDELSMTAPIPGPGPGSSPVMPVDGTQGCPPEVIVRRSWMGTLAWSVPVAGSVQFVTPAQVAVVPPMPLNDRV